ncbi:cilia- and flagella-associated protein 157 isoform X1 [Lingula anatina]|uniref:Cilia- and flagella-associated protein 157 n=1 Tax=Lingula anatina TaxID=7574 RepID=A0A1S3H860_LINAN|nr:cilia- and flagella-associated protein 157 isoform X1 [Lingula anatina]XP_013382165.1 cilia- and flagella-associated protein 157 isoform X2 [Lingula anatina]XP_013382167.1 cilia- and flagella-associated protein 157 isoform X1 [Lingula anatina]|eukprot:XP_013382164.1 cilia- and flagella-associated protein 157 isoform X1 [Lingula anatina]
MPPKKKKSAKKKKGKKSGKKSATSRAQTAVGNIDSLGKEFFLVQIRDLENRLVRYQRKCDELGVQNSKYQDDYNQEKREKKDIIEFLKKSLETKTDEIADLNDRLVGLQQLKDSEKEEYEKQLNQLKADYQETKDQLTSDNLILAGKLSSLEEFKVQKEDLMQKFANLEAELERQQKEFKNTIYDMERKSVVDKDRLKKDMVIRVNNVAAEFRKVSNKQMAETTKRTIRENVAINAQLQKMSDKTMELIQENDDFRGKEKKQRQQIDMLETNEKELAKKNHSNLKVIRMLTEKCKSQEAMIAEFELREQEYQEMESEVDLLRQQVESSRDEIQSLAKENEQLDTDLQSNQQQLRETSKNKKKLEKILSDAALALKLVLSNTGEAWGDEDHRVDLNEVEKRDNMLEHLLVILNSAAALGVGPDPSAMGKQFKMERSRSASEMPGSKLGFRRGDAPLSPLAPSKKGTLPHYQLGDLGLVPRPKQPIPTHVEKMKDLSETTRLGGLKKVLTKSVGVQTVSAPKAMFFADQLLSTASPETKSAMMRELRTSKHKLPSIATQKKVVEKVY